MAEIKKRLMTKSRFKLALDCPTKLYYTRKPEYENQSKSDTFLEALAQGGFQVEELARMEYPDGIAILGDDFNYEALASRTQELLMREQVVIFEAAFLFNGLFIRTDILIKKGKQIQLLEVKAKSVSGRAYNGFSLTSGWSAYLYDVAFQHYVIQQVHPDFTITPFLNLVDKDKTATINGLNQKFKLVSDSKLRTGIAVEPGLNKTDLGESILAKINIETEIHKIFNENPLFEGSSFQETISYFKKHYSEDIKIYTPIGNHCKGCEFYTETPSEFSKSGFHECWQEQLNLPVNEISKPKTFEVWNWRSSKKVMEEGRYFMHQLSETDFNIKPEAGMISNSERRWLQVEKTVQKDPVPHFEIDGLKDEMKSWVYPLNCIDFETTAVAIPFLAGIHPYEQLAFQYSHHVIYEDGRVEHRGEYINTEIGTFPNFDFLRALKRSLSHNSGSIFRYHNHENTILNIIYNQLKDADEPDKQDLINFIQQISHNTGSNADQWTGARDMIDLHKVVLNYYYDPAMAGSNSIKAVLPAALNSSAFLKDKYSKPLDQIGVSSLNFPEDYRFIHVEDNNVVSPYKKLPPLFEDWDAESLDAAVTQIEGISDGGAALVAYAKLQFQDVTQEERMEIENGLLRYCELDTLAMVMILEYFKDVTENFQ